MATSYFECPACHVVELITYAAADVGAAGWPPTCLNREYHEGSVSVPMILAPQPGDFAMDVGGVKGAAFKKFSVNVDGQRVEVDSLHTLRRIERESEQRYRNGEGEPLRFRMWNQSASNKDVNSFGEAGSIGEQTYGSGTPLQKSGKVGVRRHGEEAPTVKLGPGMKQAAAGVK
jgi:hypothetical protein